MSRIIETKQETLILEVEEKNLLTTVLFIYFKILSLKMVINGVILVKKKTPFDLPTHRSQLGQWGCENVSSTIESDNHVPNFPNQVGDGIFKSCWNNKT